MAERGPGKTWSILVLAGGIAVVAAQVLVAETAVLDDGQRVSGKLLEKAGRWSFQPAGGGQPLPLARVALVRLTDSPPQPPRPGPVHLVTLGEDQQVTGRLTVWDAKTCTLQTAWSGEVVLPRTAVAALWYEDPKLSARDVNLSPRPIDPTQDELWLAGGDQIFGKVAQIDREHIEFAARFGRRRYSWAEVRGIWFQQKQAPARKIEGEPVQLWLWSGQGRRQDRLVVVLRGLDDKQLTVTHPLLGERRIARKWVARLSWVLP
jgi:hypothetical protein